VSSFLILIAGAGAIQRVCEFTTAHAARRYSIVPRVLDDAKHLVRNRPRLSKYRFDEDGCIMAPD
jgi:hypothetical protein